jgi:hypothetical protein
VVVAGLVVLSTLLMVAVNPTAAGATTSSSSTSSAPGVAVPPNPDELLLQQTGAEDCTVTALTSTGTRGAFVGLGAQSTSSITNAVTSDTAKPFEVTLSQGTDVGIKLAFGLKTPPIDGSAMADAMLGFSSTSIFDASTETEAERIVQIGKAPEKATASDIALLGRDAFSNYAAGDASIGGSVGAFSYGVTAGLGAQVGVARTAGGYTQLISTVSVAGDAKAVLGLASGVSLDLVLTQDVILGPSNKLVGVTDRVTFDDSGITGFGDGTRLPGDESSTSGTPGQATRGPASPATGERGGPLTEGTVDFGLQIGSPSTGESGEVVGTLSFDGSSVSSRVLADLAKEALTPVDPVAAELAAFDIVRAIGSDGLVTYRRYHLGANTTGVAIDVGVGIDIALKFAGTDTGTTLLRAYRIAADGTIAVWPPCQQPATIHVPSLQGALPGLGATMHDWSAGHVADAAAKSTSLNPPCAPGSPPSCAGGFAESYDSSGANGDLFQVVDPAEGSLCPIPFVASAEMAAQQSCRVASMLIVLPHPVDEAAAAVLARGQLPKDIQIAPPLTPSGQLNTNIQCQVWTSATLAQLPGLADPAGSVEVAYLSGTAAIQSVFAVLLGGNAGPGFYDPNDIVGIALYAPNEGRLSLC